MRGRVYQRRGCWWVSYRVQGREVRESVARILKMPPRQVTRGHAEAVLVERRRRDSIRPRTDGRVKGFTPDDVLVSNAVRATCLPGPGPLIFNGADLRSLLGHAVYAYFVDGEAAYVGSSRQGLVRVLAPAHHVLGRGRMGKIESEHLVIWPALSEEEARSNERRLIAELQPRENRVHREDTEGTRSGSDLTCSLTER